MYTLTVYVKKQDRFGHLPPLSDADVGIPHLRRRVQGPITTWDVENGIISINYTDSDEQNNRKRVNEDETYVRQYHKHRTGFVHKTEITQTTTYGNDKDIRSSD